MMEESKIKFKFSDIPNWKITPLNESYVSIVHAPFTAMLASSCE